MNIGLVLEGGGLRGSYTAGVLVWLIEHGIEADTVVGISSGAMHACHYVMKDIEALKLTSMKYASDKNNVGIIPLLREGQPVGYNFLFEHVLKKVLKFDVPKLRAQKQTVEFGVYDLKLQKTTWKNQFTMDDDLLYLKAACTLPLAGRNVKIGDNSYLDGGVTTMIPISRAKELGAEKFLIVVTKDPGFVRKPNSHFIQFLLDLMYFKYKTLLKDFRARTQVYNDEMSEVRNLQSQGKALLLQPTRDCGVKRFSGTEQQIIDMFNLGKEDCENRKDELIAFFTK